MMMKCAVFLLKVLPILFALAFSLPAQAVEPDEVLDDPALEARARALSKELRCVVCQGEDIDSSNASVARDLRLVLREELQAGKTDEEVMEFMYERYGDFILMKPRFAGSGILLWLFGPALFVLGLILVWMFIRRSSEVPEAAGEDDA